MGGEWRQLTIADIADVYDGPHATPKKVASGPVFLGISNLSNGRLDLSESEHLSEANYVKWIKRVAPQPGDVVFSYETRLGEAAIVPDGLRCCLGRRMGLLRVKRNRADPRFVLYTWLSPAFQEVIRQRTVPGSTVDRIPIISLPDFPVGLPSLAQQRAIAHILGTLDDKIELNRRMKETVEAMARALFKSWFVDFDPVRLKAEGRPSLRSGQATPGLPNDIAGLFPDSFEDSELGEIPTGWEVKRLDEMLDLAYGKALKAENRREGNVPVYGSNGQVGWHSEWLVAGPGIVVGRKGNPGIVTWAPTDFFPIDTAFYVVPAASCPSLHFLFYSLQAHDLGSLGADSAVPGLNRNLAYMSMQVLPPIALLLAFEHLVTALAERVSEGDQQSRTLAALRDALLPKLVSGEVRVKDADRFLAERGL